MLFHSYFIPRLLRLKTRYSILYFLFCFKSFCDLSPVLSPILHFAFIIYAAFSIIFCYFLHFSCISKPIFLRILLLHRYIKSRCISFISLIHPACFFKSHTVCRTLHRFNVSYSIGSVSMMNLTLLSTPDAFPLKVSYVHSSELSALMRSITVSRSSSTVSLSFLVPSSSNSEVPSASSFAPSASWLIPSATCPLAV